MSDNKSINIDANNHIDVIKGVIDILFKGKEVNSREFAEYLVSNNNSEEDFKNIQVILEELDPKNRSWFEGNLSEIVDNVDIFQGTIDLKESAKRGDYNEGYGEIHETHNSASEFAPDTQNKSTNISDIVLPEEMVKAGVKYVLSRIKHYLLTPKLASNVLVEYSMLSSTLEPSNPDKLQCVSFVVGENDFKDRINSYYTECIRQTNLCGLSVYQHPHFLYNIDFGIKKDDKKNTDDDTTTWTWADGMGVTGTIKINDNKDGSKEKKYFIDTDSNNNPDYEVGKFRNFKGLYFDVFELERPFNEMLREAKKRDDPDKGLTCSQLSEIQNTLHSFCHKNISRDRQVESSVYISFPIYGSRASNQLPQYEIKRKDGKIALQGVGAFFIYFEPLIDLSKPIYQEIIKIIMSKIAYEMGNFIRLVSANYMFNLGLQLQEKARKEALKSARSAIMSRNMSHNLGSHVMSYLKQSLSSVQRILDDRLLALLFENNEDMLRNVRDELSIRIRNDNDEKGALPFLVGLGKFISYLQERQDFIATIATDYIPYLSTVNLKDFIYDELNPDKRYERHKDRKNFKTDNILLGNIARSEGLGRPTSPTIKIENNDNKETEESKLNDIVLKFRSFDGNPVKDGSGNVIDNEAERDLQRMRDYDLSLPGGVVGRQALFSIIENVIRNAAKHGNWREKGKLELTFDFFTKEEISLYNDILAIEKSIESSTDDDEKQELGKRRVNLTDKLERRHPNIKKQLEDKDSNAAERLSLLEVFNKFYLDALDSKDLYFITLTDNMSMGEDVSKQDEKLEKLRKAIKEPLINELGEMNEASKGIKEMRISSTWIRNLQEGETYNPIQYDKDAKDGKKLMPEKKWTPVSKEQSAPALYARISNGHLQYIFCVLRPKKVAVVSSRFPKMTTNLSAAEPKNNYNNDAFLRYSWGAFHPEDFIKEKNKSYEFVIYDEESDSDDSWWLDLRYVSSSRLLRLKETPLHDILFDNIKKMYGDTEKEREQEKKLYDSMLCQLYRHISNYQECIDNVLIDDNKVKAKIDSEIDAGDMPFHGVKVVDGEEGKKSLDTKTGTWYIYRTHHDTAKEFNKFMKEQNGKEFAPNVYVEGITGNNSTDRLVRNEDINEGWFYRHLHAMKENVAIFDERIFTKIYGLGEADLIEISKNEVNLKELRNNFLAKKNPADRKTWNEDHKNDWQEFIKKEYKVQSNDKSIQSCDSAESTTEYFPTTNSQKRVFVFTIIRDLLDPSKFNIYGLSRNLQGAFLCDELTDFGGKYISTCRKLAQLSWADDNLKVEWLQGVDYYKNMFDDISIHQGLLDKLYTVFNIKDKPELKEKLTNRFYMEFSSNLESEEMRYVVIVKEYGKPARVKRISEIYNSETAIKNDEKIIIGEPFYLLPGMCIHSGRSKPSVVDMPQRLPFIQYASIENAVLDCKYSLVELLDYARYE